jgi:hypothetical protein
MFKKLSTLCLLLSFAAQAGLPPATTKGQSDASAQTTFNIQVPFSQKTKTGGTTALIETGNKNLLVNSSFENTSVATGWTFAVTGSNTGAADTTNFTDGVKSYAITDVGGPTQSFTLSQDVTPTQQIGGKAIEVSCWVKNTIASASPTLCARSGGSDLTSGCTTIPVTSGWQQVSAQIFSATAGSSVGIDITDNLGSAGTLNVDECYVGEARNIGTVAQSYLIGGVVITGCAWNTTSTSMANFPTTTGCTYIPFGAASAPSTMLPALKFASMPAGDYEIVWDGAIGPTTASKQANLQTSDGTNFSRENSQIFCSAGQCSGFPLTHSINYSSPQSAVTLALYGQSGSGGNIAVSGTVVAKVYYFPTSAQQVLNANTSPANWSGSSTLSATTTSTSVADITTSLSGSVTTLGTPQNITCVAATAQLGVTCTLPSAGTYHVCYSGTADDGSSGPGISSLLTDGSNVAITGSQLLTSVGTAALTSFGQCGNYPASSTTATFKLRGFVGSGTGTYNLNTISVVSLNTPIAAPIINNSITTNAAGAWRHEVVSFGGSASGGAATSACTSSPCTIAVQTGSWVSSVTRTAAGSYTVTFSAGMFSAPPQCVCISGVGGVVTPTYCGYGSPVPSTSSVGIYTAGIDNAAVISCDGPR